MALAACGSGGQVSIAVEDAWVRPSPMEAGNGAGYMVIRNRSAQDDALIAVRADIAEAVEIHQTMQMEGDVTGMQPVESIPIPAGGSAILEPGGYHVMFINMGEGIEPGQSVTLTLVFQNAGEIQVQAEVREQ
jgi:copper(I)-binding protein